MNKYETIYVIRPTVEEEGIKALVERFKNLIVEQGGQVEDVDEWGKEGWHIQLKSTRKGIMY